MLHGDELAEVQLGQLVGAALHEQGGGGEGPGGAVVLLGKDREKGGVRRAGPHRLALSPIAPAGRERGNAGARETGGTYSGVSIRARQATA